MKRSTATLKRAEGKLVRSAGGIKKHHGKMKVETELKDLDPMAEAGLELSYEPEQAGEDAHKTLSAVGQAFAKRRVDEAKSMELTTDGAFYACVIFDSRDQKMAWLKAKGMDKDGDIYIDGRKLAEVDGIELPKITAKMPALFRVDKRYGAMAMGDDEQAENRASLHRSSGIKRKGK